MLRLELSASSTWLWSGTPTRRRRLVSAWHIKSYNKRNNTCWVSSSVYVASLAPGSVVVCGVVSAGGRSGRCGPPGSHRVALFIIIIIVVARMVNGVARVDEAAATAARASVL